MSYIFGKLWHSAIIWAIRKAFQCILQGVRFLLAKQTRLSGTSDNESYLVGNNTQASLPSWSKVAEISTKELRGGFSSLLYLVNHQYLTFCFSFLVDYGSLYAFVSP